MQIDGRGVGTFSIRDTYDVNANGVSNPLQTQQILTLTVPPSIGAGVITVQTNGGIATLQTGATIAAQPAFAPGSDVGDTIATAAAITLPVNATINVSGTVGDGANGTKDVDLYAITLAAGEQLSVQWTGNFYSQMRVLQRRRPTARHAVRFLYQPEPDRHRGAVHRARVRHLLSRRQRLSQHQLRSHGRRFRQQCQLHRRLHARRWSGCRPAARGSAASAPRRAAALPANAGVASANIGQTITLNGSGLLSTDQVVFTSVDDNGSLFTQTVSPATRGRRTAPA